MSNRETLAKKHKIPPARVLMSLSDLCDMLGLTRNPVMEKITQGLPYLEKGSQQAPKRSWVFDSAAVVRWIEEKARQEGHEQAIRKTGGAGVLGSPDGMGPGDGEDIIAYRTRLAKMHEAEINTAMAAREVVRVKDVVDVFTAHLADAKNTLQSVKGRVMAYLHQIKVPLIESERIVGNVIDDACLKFANADPLRSPLDVTKEDVPPTAPETPATEGDDAAEGAAEGGSDVDGDA